MSGSRFDHKNQVGGGAIKSWAQEFYDMDFQTAVQELLGQTIIPLSHSPPKSYCKGRKKEFRLPEANANMHRVCALPHKKTAVLLIQTLSRILQNSTRFTRDKEHYKCGVFVGVDENGVPRQAHKRSTNLWECIPHNLRGFDSGTAFPTLASRKSCLCLRLP